MIKVVNAISAQQIPKADTSSNEQRQIEVNANTETHSSTVDLTPPNSVGISCNSYQEFDVPSSGVILENGPAVRMVLNKVIGYKPSKFDGIVKVAGQLAQLVFSNAYGIHLWGCNFLNISRIIFTTGEPIIGGDGNLEAFRVSKGHIKIKNATKLKQFDQIDLIAYSIKINGELQANKINISTGKHQINYTNLGVPMIAAPQRQSETSIEVEQNDQVDAGRLEFAKKAQIHAHEHLKIKASILENSSRQIQSSGDLTLEVDRLDNAGTLRAQRDISLEAKTLENQSNALIDGQILTLNAQEQLKNQGVIQGSTVAISTQGLINDGTENTEEHQAGKIIAEHQLIIQAQTLHNQEQGVVYSDGELTIGDIPDTPYKVDGAMQELVNSNSSTIESRKKLSIQAGYLDNEDGQIKAGSALILRSQAVTNRQGCIEAKGDQSVLDVRAKTIDNISGWLLNAGTGKTQIIAQEALGNSNPEAIEGAGIIFGKGLVTIQSPELLNDAGGAIISDQILKIKAPLFAHRRSTLSASQRLEINTDQLTSAGGLIAVGDDEKLKTETSPSVKDLPPYISHVGVLKVRAKKVINTWYKGEKVQNTLIRVQGRITIKAQAIYNTYKTQILGQHVTLSAVKLFSNSNSAISAHDAFTLMTEHFVNTQGGSLQSKGEILLKVKELENRERALIDGRFLTLLLQNQFKNSGVIQGSTITINARSLINDGGISASDAFTLTAEHLVNTHGATLQSNGDILLEVKEQESRARALIARRFLTFPLQNQFKNSGVIQGSTITINARNLINDGGIFASNAFTLTAEHLVNTHGATLQSNGDILLEVKELESQARALIARGFLTFALPNQLKNSGVIQGSTITIGTQKLINNNVISARNAFTLTAEHFVNTHVGSLQSKGDILLEVKELENREHALIDGRFLTLLLQNQLKNSAVIQGSTITISAQKLINDGANDAPAQRAGKIIARHHLTIGAQTLHNQEYGLLHSDGGLSIGGTLDAQHKVKSSMQHLVNSSSSTIESKEKLSIQAGQLDNKDGQIKAGSELILKSQKVNNRQGRVEAKGDQSVLDIRADAIGNISGWLLNAGTGKTQIIAQQALRNSNPEAIEGAGIIFGKGSVIIQSPELLNDAGGAIISDRILKIKTPDLGNRLSTLSASQEIEIDADKLDNIGGLITVGEDEKVQNTLIRKITIKAQNIYNSHKTQILGQHVNLSAEKLFSNSDSTISARDAFTLMAERFINFAGGNLQSKRDILLEVKYLENQFESSIDGAYLKVKAKEGWLKNWGVIQGSTITIGAQDLINDGANDTEEQQAGVIIARHHLTIGSQTLRNREQGLLHSDGDLNIGETLDAQHGVKGSMQQLMNSSSSTIESREKLSIQASQLDNKNGQIKAGLALTLKGQVLNNQQGRIEAKGDQSELDVQAEAIINNISGWLLNTGTGKTQIIAQQALRNSNPEAIEGAGIIFGKGSVIIQSPELLNDAGGAIISDQTLKIKTTLLAHTLSTLSASRGIEIDTDKLASFGGLIAIGNDEKFEAETSRGVRDSLVGVLEVRAKEVTNSWHKGEKVQNTLIRVQGRITIQAQNIHNAHKTQILGQRVDLSAEKLFTNSDSAISARDAFTLTAECFLNCVGANLKSNGEILLEVKELQNQSESSIEGAHLKLKAKEGWLKNWGVIQADATAINAQNPAVQEGQLTIEAEGFYNSNTGRILAKDLNLNAKVSFLNEGGTVSASDTLSLAAQSVKNLNKGFLQSDKDLHISVTDFGNSGTVHGKDQVLIKSARELNFRNERPGLILGKTVSIGAHDRLKGFLVNQGGVIFAQDKLEMGFKEITNLDNGTLYSGAHLTIGGALDVQLGIQGLSEQVLNHSALIDASGDLTIHANKLLNQNARFEAEERLIEERGIHECYDHHTGQRFDGSQLGWDGGCGGSYYLVHNSGHKIPEFTNYEFTRRVTTTIVTHSEPGRIQAGGAIRLSDQVINDKSRIIAGGTLSNLEGRPAQIENQDVVGKRVTTDQGTSQYSDRNWRGGWARRFKRDWSGLAPYHPAPIVEHHNLNIAVYQEHTAVDHSAPSTALVPSVTGQRVTTDEGTSQRSNRKWVGGLKRYWLDVSPQHHTEVDHSASSTALLPSSSTLSRNALLNSGLLRLNTDLNQPYLIQIDPRFTRNSDRISSDLLLQLLNLDPQRVPKRLGDGFYEQQMIRDQIIGLTGHYYLSNHRNPIAEIRNLMHAGADWANRFQLKLGIEPTSEQINALTSSPIWLVNQRVQLPDGSEQTVLAPKVYLAQSDAQAIPLGNALISADTIELHSDRPFKNTGTVLSRGKANISASQIDNLRGTLASLGTLSIQARDDIDSRAGKLIAVKKLTLQAGQALQLQSQTQITHAASGSRTNLAGLTQIQAGELEASAGSDIHLAATQIEVEHDAKLEAKQDLILGTVTADEQLKIVWDERNALSLSKQTEVGTQIQASALELKAGRDVTATGAYVKAAEKLAVKAGRDIHLEAAYEETDFEESHYHESSHFFGSSSELTHNALYRKQALSSTLSGGTVQIEAGHDLNILGSNVVGMGDVDLYARNDIKQKAVEQNEKSRHYFIQERSGLLESGKFGVTIGNRTQKDTQENERTLQIGSVIGSISGHVRAVAGREYEQSGSQLVVPTGDIGIQAGKGKIEAAYEQGQVWQRSERHQSGLTVSVGAPVLAAAQTNQQMLQASTQVSDPRMQALAAGAGALATKNAYDAIKADPKAAGGATVSVMIGEEHSETEQMQLSRTALNSTLAAGGNISIQIGGLGEESTLDLIGARIEAKQNIELNVEGRLNVEAAPNSSIEQSQQQSHSSAVGAVATLGRQSSVDASIALSIGHGHAEGAQINYTPTLIQADGKLELKAKSDVRLKGAQMAGKQVKAQIDGNLEIESVQNTATYQSHAQSISGSATEGSVSAVSLNVSQRRMDSHYLSVAEQAGIQAGDEGFQITVKGDTKLVGGVIESSEQAVQKEKNKLITATLQNTDLTNQASYDASSISLGGGYSQSGKAVGSDQSGEATTPAHSDNQLASRGRGSAAVPIALSASGQARSTTRSAISGAEIVITDEARQIELMGRSTAETIADLNRNPAQSHQALVPIFNPAKIEASFDIVNALGRETGTFLVNRAKEADQKLEQAKAIEMLVNVELLPIERQQALQDIAIELRTQAQALNKQWGPGGLSRQILTALTAAASGNVTGATEQFVQSGVVNLLQQQGAGYVGELVKSGAINEGSPAHVALHTLVGLGGAAASNQSLAAGALGGAVSSILTHAFSPTHPDETRTEQEAKHNIATTLVAGVVALTGADATVAMHSAAAAIDNNWLATEQKALVLRERQACGDDLTCKILTELKWTGVSAKQNALFGVGFIQGIGDSSWELLEGVAELVVNLPDTINRLISLVKDKEIRAQVGEAISAEWDAKRNRIELAIAQGGDQNALQMGCDVGNLFFQAITAIAAAGGALRLAASLGRVGIHVGKKTLEEVSKLSKLGQLKNVAPGKELGRVVGRYSAISSIEESTLAADWAKTFAGGRYTEILLKQDTVLYRAGAAGRPVGDYFSQKISNGVIQSRIDKAILPKWPDGSVSHIDSLMTVKVPAGTTVYVGEIGSQGGFYVGGTQQIIVPNAKAVKGIKILNVIPLK